MQTPPTPWMVYTHNSERVYNIKLHHFFIDTCTPENALQELKQFIVSEGGPEELVSEINPNPGRMDHPQGLFSLVELQTAVHDWGQFLHMCLVKLFSAQSTICAVQELLDDPRYAYHAYRSIAINDMFITEAVTTMVQQQRMRPKTLLVDLVRCMYQYPDNVLAFKDDLRGAIQFLLRQGLDSMYVYLLTRLPFLRLYYGNENSIRNYVPVCRVLAFVLDSFWPVLTITEQVRIASLIEIGRIESKHWDESILRDVSSRTEYSKAAWCYVMYLSGALKEAALLVNAVAQLRGGVFQVL